MHSTHKIPQIWIIEPAIGDGSCFSNAATLGFCQKSIFDKLKKLGKEPTDDSLFVQEAAIILKVEATWRAVKQQILKLRYLKNHQDRNTLQISLSPLMRRIAIDEAEKDPRHLESTKQPLMSAFHNYVLEKLNLQKLNETLSDDIYKRHPFIQTKFGELLNQTDEWLRSHFNIDEYNKLKNKNKSSEEEKQFNILQATLDETILYFQNELIHWWINPPYKLIFRDFVKTRLSGKDYSSPLSQNVQQKFNELYKQVLEFLGDDSVAQYLKISTADIKDLNTIKELHLLDQALDIKINALQDELFAYLSTQKNFLHLLKELSVTSCGYEQFLEAMRNPKQWGGDLELAQLAKYLHISLSVKKDDYIHHIHYECGKLPLKNENDNNLLTQNQIDQLIIRNIVDRPHQDQPDLDLFPINSKTLRQRLGVVPDYATVKEYIEGYKDNLQGAVVPSTWSSVCVDELIQRNVISRTKQSADHNQARSYAFDVDYTNAVARIEAVENKDDLIAAWNENYIDSPLVILTNHQAVHWDNMLSPVEAKLISDGLLFNSEDDIMINTDIIVIPNESAVVATVNTALENIHPQNDHDELEVPDLSIPEKPIPLEEENPALSTVAQTNIEPPEIHIENGQTKQVSVASQMTQNEESVALSSSFIAIYDEIIGKLDTGEIKSTAEKWGVLIAKLEEEAEKQRQDKGFNLPQIDDEASLEYMQLTRKVQYSIPEPDGEETDKTVTEQTQIKLDEEFAKRLYEEEYHHLISKRLIK